MKKCLLKATIILSIILFIYWLPFFIIMLEGQSNIIDSIDELPEAEVAIIFGTQVSESEVFPLLKERLDAGKKLLEMKKVKKLVVSNTEDAANIMAQYLIKEGVEEDLIEIDIQAEKTPDTCKYEMNEHPEKREIIFISQGFHLSRLLFQCKKVGVEGIAFPAETLRTINSSEYSIFTKISTRTFRYTREAGLTWLAVLNIYK